MDNPRAALPGWCSASGRLSRTGPLKRSARRLSDVGLGTSGIGAERSWEYRFNPCENRLTPRQNAQQIPDEREVGTRPSFHHVSRRVAVLDAIDPKVPDAGVAAPQTDAIDMEPKTTSAGPILRRASSLVGLRTLAFVLVIAATSLYLLERLEPVLRPLLIAILLSYLFLPAYTWLRRYMRPIFSFLIIAVGIALGLQGLARMVYRDVVLINHNL